MRKNTLPVLIPVLLLFHQAPAQDKPAEKTVTVIDTRNYNAFRKSVRPLINTMGAKKIVGLGEGTHGTAEFYRLRAWITRILVEEKGFNQIAFENDASDAWFLDNQLNTETDIRTLMKKYLLSIWQNEETRELLSWVRDHNKKHGTKVRICGLDYVMLKPDVALLERLLAPTPDTGIRRMLAGLSGPAACQDEAWESMNRRDYKPDFDALTKSSYRGYLLADTLDREIAGLALSPAVKAACHMALVNIRQGFGPFYSMAAKTPEISRDSSMAYNAYLQADRMIIWAHNAHLAKKGIYNNAVGGAGGHLLRMFPGNYFVLGTGTATGTFAATTERRDTYTNPMAAYPLEKPQKGSWEALLDNMGRPAVYFIPAVFNPGQVQKPLRFIGYNPDSGPKTYDQTNITDLFDAFLFVRETHAATPLER